MTQTHTYAHARSLIRTGDMVALETSTLFGDVIRVLQKIAGLEYAWATHCALAIWIGDGLYVFEMGPSGNIFKPLSQYEGCRMVVCEPAQKADIGRFHFAVTMRSRSYIPYGLVDLVRIGLRLLPLRFIDTKAWGRDGDGDKVCSLLPAWVYSLIGGDVSHIARLACPAEVVGGLRVRFEIQG